MEIIVDGVCEIIEAKDNAEKGEKSNEKQNRDSDLPATERRQNVKPLQLQTEGSMKGLGLRGRVHCNNHNGNKISKNFGNEHGKEEWPGLKLRVQVQQTRKGQHSQKKGMQKNKNTLCSQGTKPYSSPVAKLGLASSASDGHQGVRDRHFKRSRHEGVDDKQKREGVHLEMKESVLTDTKSEDQESKEVATAQARAFPGFENENLNPVGIKPPPGISTLEGILPPPGFESTQPITGALDIAILSHETDSGFETLNKS